LKLRIEKKQTFIMKLISIENRIEKPNQSRLPGCQQILSPFKKLKGLFL